MGLHDGHRQRTKEEFLTHGLDAFSALRTLELLLFYSRPQGDVTPTAKALLETFGSLEAVFAASQEELAKVPGVGQHTVVLLRLLADMAREYLAPPPPQSLDIRDTRFLSALFAPCFRSAEVERCAVACFGKANQLLSLRLLDEGTLFSTEIQIRDLASIALECNSRVIVLAHNHPSGNPLPSQEDINTTQYLCQCLKLLDIRLADHVIVGKEDSISMWESGYFAAF